MSNQIGDQYRLHASFTAEGGTPTDPDEVVLTIRAPDGTETTPVPAHDGVGEFTYYLLLESWGTYLWRWQGIGTVFQTEEGSIQVDRSLFEPEPEAARGDYFSRAEFRAYAGDLTDPPRYGDRQIDVAQAEVVEALESWGRTSWANVTGTDGDGTAAENRRAVERVALTSRGRLILGRRPLIAVRSVQTVPIGVEPGEVEADTYDANLGAAILTFAPAVAWGAGAWITTSGDVRVPWPTRYGEFRVDYEYGYGSTPWSVKVPVMKAARSRLDETVRTSGSSLGGSSRIPANTRVLTSSRATLEFGDGSAASVEDLPWTWDPQASAEIRALWDRARPKIVFSVVGG